MDDSQSFRMSGIYIPEFLQKALNRDPDFHPVGGAKRMQEVFECVKLDSEEGEITLDDLDGGSWTSRSTRIKREASELVKVKTPSESFLVAEEDEECFMDWAKNLPKPSLYFGDLINGVSLAEEEETMLVNSTVASNNSESMTSDCFEDEDIVIIDEGELKLTHLPEGSHGQDVDPEKEYLENNDEDDDIFVCGGAAMMAANYQEDIKYFGREPGKSYFDSDNEENEPSHSMYRIEANQRNAISELPVFAESKFLLHRSTKKNLVRGRVGIMKPIKPDVGHRMNSKRFKNLQDAKFVPLQPKKSPSRSRSKMTLITLR